MRIILLTWDYHGQTSISRAFSRLGYEVRSLPIDATDILDNPAFRAQLGGLLQKGQESGDPFRFVFSHDYFPAASDVCETLGVPYLSLVYDSPHYALTSATTDNRVNHIYVFDRGLIEALAKAGTKNLHHTLLPGDPTMAETAAMFSDKPYAHEVSFLGSLYQDGYNFFDQIGDLPDALREFLDTAVAAQRRIFGCDLLGDPTIVPDKVLDALLRYVNFSFSGNYRLDPQSLLRDIIRKKVTSLERADILARLGERFAVDLYTAPNTAAPPGVRNLGYADYDRKMPRIFNRSKVNINITLRTIRTGIPQRAMDVMACGGFLLSDYREELAEFFVEGEELALARTPEDFLEKTAYYLAHDAERERIARNGQRRVLADYSQDKILSCMIAESHTDSCAFAPPGL